MKVKVCGITNARDAVMCESLGADCIGLVHFPGRSRSLEVPDIRGIFDQVGPMTVKVLVCSPKSASDALDMFEESGADALQLHSLSPAQLEELRSSGVKVFRAVPPERAAAEQFFECSDALVFEDGTPGTGHRYDYSRIPVEFLPRGIIAGGLSVSNIHAVKRLDPYGVDVSSGVERTVGVKDPKLVNEFIRRCRE